MMLSDLKSELFLRKLPISIFKKYLVYGICLKLSFSFGTYKQVDVHQSNEMFCIKLFTVLQLNYCSI